MFGPRRRGLGYRRGFGGGSFGLILLAMQLFSFFRYLSSRNEFYPVTLVTLGLNILAYFKAGSSHAWPGIRDACISVQGVWFQKEWKRFFLAPIYHGSDFHLYYNMASFMWKAISMERHYGTAYFAYMMAVFTALTNILYLCINYLLAELLDQWSYVQSCAVGFSGVIFAVKVVTTYMQPRGTTMVMGFLPVPMRLACWFELVVISVLFPNVSFVGHLSGILVGLAFVSGPLKAIMDLPLSLMENGVTGLGGRQREDGRAYTYAARPTGRGPADAGGLQDARQRRTERRPHPPTSQPAYTSYTYAAGATGFQDRGADGRPSNDEEMQLQEVIRRSMLDAGGSPPSAPGPAPGPAPVISHEDEIDERDVQVALERSMADIDPPPADVERVSPPPYNPNFPTAAASGDHEQEGTDSRSDLMQSADTVPVVGRAEEEGSEGLRHRTTVDASHRGSSEMTRDQLRSARLRRLANAASK